ncbi:hypothetical protein BSL78_13336 [Apostichopus japonicus]|uniref:Ig-like domain-containing protein n=1 Tax=Stichopus japonicus TaxID=307972 RepID=A0A2G8KP46_STIJA|nr:hypothetical protein BSL78_13336 [Apostichopus japonicus]
MQESPFKLISVTVLVNYRPSNPICSSSQKLIFFKDDVTNATAVLQCSLGDIGRPKSTLSFQFQNGSSVNSSVIISGNNLEASISILPSVRMNNSYISCIVRQDIPSSMSTTSFEDSCSFPPILFLEELQVMITPSMYTMNDSGNITFTCSSNAGPLDNVTWKIKSEVPNSVTKFAKHDQITFQVNNSKMSNSASIVFECFGKVQNHTGRANADLVLQQSSSESNLDSMMYSLYVALLVIVLFCVTIAYSFLRRTRKPRMDLRDDESPTDSKKNDENGRNVSHIPPRKCDDDKMSVVNYCFQAFPSPRVMDKSSNEEIEVKPNVDADNVLYAKIVKLKKYNSEI